MATVLVIDDDISLIKFLTAFLEENDWIVYSATTGEEGWETIKNVYPDVVLLDIRLPDVEGVELLEKIRKFDENIPVIVISGINEVKIAVEAIKKGAYDYITKPNDRRIENEKRICQTYSNNSCFIVRYYFNFW